jgi:hypothetical protein
MSRSNFAARCVRNGFVATAFASQVALSLQPNRVARTGSLDGIVTDTSLSPLLDATVSILGSGVRVVTGGNGRFRITDLPAGRYVLLIRRVGFEPSSAAITITQDDTVRASFTLVRLGTVLDTVVVAGTRLSRKMQEFEQRRKLAEGRFMTAEDIDSLHVVSMGDVLYHLISNRVRPALRVAVGAPCVHAQWYLDGVLLPPSTTTDDLGPPSAMAGIEYYSGPTTIPVQYKSTSGAGFCGVVLMWTKDGSERPQS